MTGDPLNGCRFLHQVYTKADSSYSGRVTVPVLWDRELGTIVNNESAEILRMLNREFDAFGDASVDLYPEDPRTSGVKIVIAQLEADLNNAN